MEFAVNKRNRVLDFIPWFFPQGFEEKIELPGENLDRVNGMCFFCLK